MERLKILIVEDNKSMQSFYDKALTENIFNKRFSDNGKEALEIYESWKPAIIVLDVYLPYMTGYAVLKEIREIFDDKDTTIIMATVLNHEEHIKDAIKFGIQGYLVKPLNFKEIGTRILQCYQKRNDFIQSVQETT